MLTRRFGDRTIFHKYSPYLARQVKKSLATLIFINDPTADQKPDGFWRLRKGFT
jgi:hypothetical protein